MHSHVISHAIDLCMYTHRLRLLQVNQISMGVGGARPEANLAFCAAHNITVEAYWTLTGCPYTSKVLQKVAAAHGPQTSTAMVCVAWVLGRGVVVAAGTGANASTVAQYSIEDLSATTLVLTDAEMVAVGAIGAAQRQRAWNHRNIATDSPPRRRPRP